MSRWTSLLVSGFALVSLAAGFGAQAKDEAGSFDSPIVGRYQGSSITFFKQSAFDEVKMLSGALDVNDSGKKGDVWQTYAGKAMIIQYEPPKGRSSLEVFTNLKQNLADKGAEVLFECKDEACYSKPGEAFYRFADALSDGRSQVYNASQEHIRYVLAKAHSERGDTYISLLVGEYKSDSVVFLKTVEVKGMETDKIVFVDANAMKQGLLKDGRISLYGIFFDTDKDVPKPESKPTLDEIGKLLKADPGLNLIVVGHTDNVGEFKYNIDLSNRRAANVSGALAKTYGVAAGRVLFFGAGMAAPAASNDNDEGRAKNRRVELVKR